MISIQSLSIKFAHYICSELGMDRPTEIRMIFGLELFLGAVLKTFFIGSVAAIFGIFPETMILALAAGILRIFSGGEHCQAFYRCLLGGGITYIVLGLAVHSLKIDLTNMWVIHGLFIFIMIVINKYAPADTANRRITDMDDIRKYKIKALIVVAIIWIFITVSLELRLLMSIVAPIITGLLWQALTVTPIGYKFIQTIDKMLTLEKEVA